jgi:hypothetical protein
MLYTVAALKRTAKILDLKNVARGYRYYQDNGKGTML